jgi:hypothetical protein
MPPTNEQVLDALEYLALIHFGRPLNEDGRLRLIRDQRH